MTKSFDLTYPWEISRSGAKITITITRGSDYEAIVMMDHMQDEIRAHGTVRVTLELDGPKAG